MPSDLPATAVVPDAFERFGDLLHYLRRRAQLTQRELSIAVGYNFAQISRLESGQRLPDPAVIAAVFVPALELDHQPAWAARLIALAESAARQSVDLAAVARLDAAAPAAVAAPPEPPAAPNVLLATKLYLPRARADLLPRPRLLRRLDAAHDVPLTLIIAPAGFGKTTLLANWLQTERLAAGGWRLGEASPAASPQPLAAPAAWLSLDADDNDPITFVRYLVAALQTLGAQIGATTRALLQLPQLPPLPLLLTPLLNDLAALRADSLLILDDYHLVSAPTVHAALLFLLDHMPPALHLVLASRADPALPLARMRARRELLELRAPDLRFTAEETYGFVRESMGVGVSPDEAALLEVRTEGWVAGLQLAALALHDRADRSSFLAGFGGGHRYVADYLAAEVLDGLPAHLRTFVLQTSILERLCGPLCDAVLGIGDRGSAITAELPNPDPRSRTADAYSQLILGELERMNLFLVPLDDARHWYRYHHLFAEMLRTRLRAGAAPADIDRLHRRASAWYARQGLVAETVQHALAGHDWEHAAQVIEEQGLHLMMGGQVHIGLGWLSSFPEPIIVQRPLLCIIHAIGLMLRNQIAAAEARLRDAEHSLPPGAPDELVRVVQGSVAGVRGRFQYFAGDLAHAMQSLQQALALLPESTTGLATGRISAMARAAWGVYLVMAYQLTGDVGPASERQASDAIAPARALGHLMATLNGYTSLAALQVLQGRLRTAAATYAEIERLVPGQDALHTLVGSPAYYMGLGDLLREWNQLDAAQAALERGMAFLQGSLVTDAGMVLHGYVALARVHQARGNTAAARATLNGFGQLVTQRALAPQIVEQAAAMAAYLRLQQGDLGAAIRWADASGLDPDAAPSFPREAADLTLARVRIAGGQAAAILPLLERLLADAEAKARGHSAIEIRALQALAAGALGDRERALATLAEALAWAEPEGYIRTFADEGAPMRVLLEALRANGVRPAYIEQLIAAIAP